MSGVQSDSNISLEKAYGCPRCSESRETAEILDYHLVVIHGVNIRPPSRALLKKIAKVDRMLAEAIEAAEANSKPEVESLIDLKDEPEDKKAETVQTQGKKSQGKPRKKRGKAAENMSKPPKAALRGLGGRATGGKINRGLGTSMFAPKGE